MTNTSRGLVPYIPALSSYIAILPLPLATKWIMLKFVLVGAGSFIEMNGRPESGSILPTIFSYPVLSEDARKAAFS